MSTSYAPFEKPRRFAPRYYVYSARFVPLGILAQFFLAGLSLFQNPIMWGAHATAGFLLLLPVAIVSLTPLALATIRPLRWWSGILGALYIMQIAWIVAGQSTGSGLLKAMHVLNGGLLLATALVIVAKLEKSRAG